MTNYTLTSEATPERAGLYLCLLTTDTRRRRVTSVVPVVAQWRAVDGAFYSLYMMERYDNVVAWCELGELPEGVYFEPELQRLEPM